MKIFITGTNTDVGKTYVVTRLWQWLNHRGISTVIFKPFQTEELEEGLYPDLEAYRTLCGLDYELTGLYTFHEAVSPHLAFKQEPYQQFDLNKVLSKLAYFETQYDVVLIEGAGGIAVPIYVENETFFMTTDLIKATADVVLSVVPAKLGAISETLVHQSYLDTHECPPNIILMNRYTDTVIEQDNRLTLQSYLKTPIVTFPENGKMTDIPETIFNYFKEVTFHETSNTRR